jgi:hypothetical protein
MKAIRPRLTYANVVATGALFLALGGGAYALTGVPDHSGVFHGCVSRRTGGLRVVTSARSCHATRRRHGRVVDPGESAIAWNQQGPRGLQGQGIRGPQGLQGLQGNMGLKGDKGDTGPAGPTQGFVHGGASGSVPSSTPDSGAIMQTTATTSASGRLFVFARGSINVKCTTGDTTFVQLGVYVDGAAVPATGRVIAAGSAGTEISVWGLSATVSPGPHLVEVASDCQPGDTTTGTGVGGDAALGAILVGS